MCALSCCWTGMAHGVAARRDPRRNEAKILYACEKERGSSVMSPGVGVPTSSRDGQVWHHPCESLMGASVSSFQSNTRVAPKRKDPQE